MPEATAPAPVRSFWSGTITFGLVSIPVDFYAAARPRQKALKLVDAQGHPLGRQYTRESDGKPLSRNEIVRGYETDDGRLVVVTDEEFASAAPETSRDIDLHRFVPLAQIAPAYFVRPYFLAPAARSGKAYTLLAQTMERSGKVGIGRLVMRSHEYLVALIAEGGVLRAETLRTFDELRTPEAVGLPAPVEPPRKLLDAFAREVGALIEKRLDLHELEDREAEALQALAQRKARQGRDVVEDAPAAEDADADADEGGAAKVVDLVQLLRRSLAGRSGEAPAKAARTESPPAPPAPTGSLADKTREELYRMAAERQLPGRSRMNKAQLLEALQPKRARRRG
ncbi:hypothetical protein JI739_21825 [Ramlibacter sp. AW1]|uniref:Non-homologous end joining protein Ku n=1 Tax=Ramlibacter aurantiacus TaxID=2801330 RepID=A0A937D9B8_9BURK|nr:Ku protein [Ramlibacter aurantiacus]MBL0422991.1 hypothetical protein [Ramlibacter aurantiacus]